MLFKAADRCASSSRSEASVHDREVWCTSNHGCAGHLLMLDSDLYRHEFQFSSRPLNYTMLAAHIRVHMPVFMDLYRISALRLHLKRLCFVFGPSYASLVQS